MWGFQPLLVAASVGVNIPATLDVGTFTLTGQTASIPLAAGTGVFTLTGIGTGVPPLFASSGAFVTNGQVLDVTLAGFATGTFALTGQALGLATYRLTAEPGKFYFSGRAFNQPIAASSAVKIITLGDSIFENANGNVSATRIDNQADGEIHWVKARGKAGFQHDNWYAADAYWIDPSSKPHFKGANQGWGGDWALNVLNRLTAVINMNPDIVVLDIGTNNGLDPLTSDAASVISQIGQIVAALAGTAKPNGSGIIRLVIGTIRPRAVTATASSGLYTYEQTPAFYGRRNTINGYIRTLDNGSTVFLWDPEPDLLDPNPTAPLLTGSIYRWGTRDGVHLSPRGAYASSRTLELAIDRVLGDGAAFNTDASVSNAITNGVLTGTGGTVSGVSGQAPDNTTVQIVNGATAFVSGVSSVGAGGWTFAITCTGGSSSATNTNVIRAESNSISVFGQGWSSTTWIKAYAEVEVSNQQVLGALHLDLLTGASTRSQGLGPTISNRATEAFADGGWSGWIETTAQQVGLETPVKARIDIEPYIDRAGDATVTIKRWIIRSVTDPHTLFPFDPMNPVSIALTGQPITFNLAGTHPSLIADTGLFTPPTGGLSGQVALLLRQLRLTAGDGTFVVVGGGSSPLTDEQGAFLIDDEGAVLIVQDSEAVTFSITKSIIADVVVFTLTGIDADFPKQSPGVYSSSAEKLDLFLNGQDVNLAKHTLATFDVGEFELLVFDADFLNLRIPLTADFGDFVFAGQIANFPIHDLDAETGLFILSGFDVDLTVARRLIHVRFGPLLRAPRRMYPGETVAINGTFYDENGVEFDPYTVMLRIVGPFGPLRSYTYGSDVEVRKTADGRYVFDLDLDAPGRWSFQWVVTVSGITSVKQGSLSVQDTPFYQFPRQRYTG